MLLMLLVKSRLKSIDVTYVCNAFDITLCNVRIFIDIVMLCNNSTDITTQVTLVMLLVLLMLCS